MNSAMLQRDIMNSFKLRGLGLGRDSLKVLLDHLKEQPSYKEELSRIVDHVVGSSDCENLHLSPAIFLLFLRCGSFQSWI
jgi:hypothetical protein